MCPNYLSSVSYTTAILNRQEHYYDTDKCFRPREGRGRIGGSHAAIIDEHRSS